ncbi:DUF1292 domain-containing protein [Abyssisolibacter fermentans]|uniref:DUF1292 domain-containing protein n=1 Tax=Abyssisolibacter fermentans TaxID=1766203 RepID=UPI00082EC100|nr:DUF1292 domain-containing protein [Abyssisolibacter fermentans]
MTNNCISICVDGKNVDCKIMASFVMKSNEYVILLNEKENEAYAFKVIDDEFKIIDDENELDDVMKILHKGYKH